MKKLKLTLLLGLSGEQFRGRVPSEGFSGRDTRVEWFEAGAFRALLLAEFVGAVAEHDTLVVSNAGFGPVTAGIAATQALARLIDLSS